MHFSLWFGLNNLLEEVIYCAILIHNKNEIKELFNNDTILYFFTDLFLYVM